MFRNFSFVNPKMENIFSWDLPYWWNPPYDLSNILSAEDCAWLFLSRTHQKNTSVKLCTMPEGFQLFQPGGDGSHTSLTIDEVSWWYLLASLLYFPFVLGVLNIWKGGGAKTFSSVLVHTINGFLHKKQQVLLMFSVPISAILTWTQLLLKNESGAQVLRASGQTSGWVPLQLPFEQVQNCAYVHRSVAEADYLPMPKK